MKYAKPELVVLDNAIRVVQLSKSIGPFDSEDPESMIHSPAAYQADE